MKQWNVQQLEQLLPPMVAHCRKLAAAIESTGEKIANILLLLFIPETQILFYCTSMVKWVYLPVVVGQLLRLECVPLFWHLAPVEIEPVGFAAIQ